MNNFIDINYIDKKNVLQETPDWEDGDLFFERFQNSTPVLDINSTFIKLDNIQKGEYLSKYNHPLTSAIKSYSTNLEHDKTTKFYGLPDYNKLYKDNDFDNMIDETECVVAMKTTILNIFFNYEKLSTEKLNSQEFITYSQKLLKTNLSKHCDFYIKPYLMRNFNLYDFLKYDVLVNGVCLLYDSKYPTKFLIITLNSTVGKKYNEMNKLLNNRITYASCYKCVDEAIKNRKTYTYATIVSILGLHKFVDENLTENRLCISYCMNKGLAFIKCPLLTFGQFFYLQNNKKPTSLMEKLVFDEGYLKYDERNSQKLTTLSIKHSNIKIEPINIPINDMRLSVSKSFAEFFADLSLDNQKKIRPNNNQFVLIFGNLRQTHQIELYVASCYITRDNKMYMWDMLGLKNIFAINKNGEYVFSLYMITCQKTEDPMPKLTMELDDDVHCDEHKPGRIGRFFGSLLGKKTQRSYDP